MQAMNYHFDKLMLWCQNGEDETINDFRRIVLGAHNKSQYSNLPFLSDLVREYLCPEV